MADRGRGRGFSVRVTRTPYEKSCPEESTLRAFMAVAHVHPVPKLERLKDGRIWLRFTGKDRADDWSFWLERGEFTEWLRATGAKLYRYTFLPTKAQGISIAWPAPLLDDWNRSQKDTWEYSLVTEGVLP